MQRGLNCNHPVPSPGARLLRGEWHEAWQKWIRDSANYASKRRAPGGNVIQLPPGETLSGTDATVAGWAAPAAELDTEDSA
ncbi:hypothetical protein [Streptomyces sp. Ncost-T10-10d]|uniref:hypothetical protein n=1 Tax=Streptomyces sp. Ncost-T10-10d TaxID=1839774 RepID=UPI00159EFCDA|nr:hypothetical protein [Streptomyces sp. Ncost-T10-10d]